MLNSYRHFEETAMAERFMLLPAPGIKSSRLLQVPDDWSERDAVRHVTALIASIQETTPEWTWEDLAPALEEHGFTPVEFILGPSLD
jgi:hypothetical protein